MYSHAFAGRITQTDFKALVSYHGYYEHPNVPYLFLHCTRPTVFTLIVDDIGIEVFSDDDLQHLITTIRNKWELKVDRTGAKYSDLCLIWDYSNNSLITDVPNHVAESLVRLNLPDIKPHITDIPIRDPSRGIHYLVTTNASNQTINGPIQTTCRQLSESVCASTMESEYAALFINAACIPTTVPTALGYAQKPTIIHCKNSPAQGIAQREVTFRRSKVIHARYHWIRDGVD